MYTTDEVVDKLEQTLEYLGEKNVKLYQRSSDHLFLIRHNINSTIDVNFNTAECAEWTTKMLLSRVKAKLILAYTDLVIFYAKRLVELEQK